MDLNEALAAYKPVLTERYSDLVRSYFARMVKDHGESLKGISGSWTYAKTYRGLVSENLTTENGAKSINGDTLARNAAAYADAAIDGWKDKINAKLGELNEADVARLNGVAFSISGRDSVGRRIDIEQQMIFKISTLGTPFNQFPARIYVDGKFTSEAAYKRIAGEPARTTERGGR
jgi:hypothetical protein